MKIGQKLKDLNFKIDESLIISSKDLEGKKLVIYFYPKDDTPGCTKEAESFSEYSASFEKNNTLIIGVSKDSVEKHKKFILKYNLKLKLAADEDLSLCKAFNVWVEKSMYGKKYMGIERSTFLFDENLKLVKEWRKVKVKGHVEEVLNFIIN
tara:strand:- start:1266 stop:1721 length:456 start_codon:yes stop_codon:yes gene_type:complete